MKTPFFTKKISIDKNKERYFSLFFPYSYLLMFSLLWYCLPGKSYPFNPLYPWSILHGEEISMDKNMGENG